MTRDEHATKRAIETKIRERLKTERLNATAPAMFALLKESIAQETCEWSQEQWEDWDSRAGALVAQAEGTPPSR